jgi:hypothetical protein
MKQKFVFGGILMACLFIAVLCSVPAYAAPSVSITSYTGSIELDYLGSVQWTISSDTKETGVNYAYKSDKSDAKGVVSPSTGLASYAAVVVPKRGNCQIYFRVYAKGNNNVIVYSPWYMISTAAYCSAYAKTAYSPSMNLEQVPVMRDAESGQTLYAAASACTDKEIPFEIQELDYAYIAGDTVKDFVIGGCMNDGIISFNCALDIGGILPITKITKIPKLARFAKFTAGLNKLKQGYTTTKFLGSIQKVSSAVKKMFVWSSKGKKATRTGKEVAEGVSQGILREEIAKTGKIFEKTEFQKLGDWVLEKGTASVTALKGKLFNNAEMERYLTKSVDLDKLKTYATRTGKHGWSPDQVDESATLMRGLEKWKGTDAVRQAVISDDSYVVANVLPDGKNADLLLKNINGKGLTMEAKGIEKVLSDTRKLESTLGEVGVQLKSATGEKSTVIVTRAGTTLSESTIRSTVSNWLKNDAQGKTFSSVIVHINENNLLLVTR